MSDANVSRLGQANGAGDAKALFYKVFSGEVLSSFNANTVMADKTRVRSITSGKSAGFAAIGKIGASYHTPGTEITGQNVDHGEKVVTIDDLLLSDAFIANIDEAMNHYEVRSEYSMQMGQALAQTFDRNLLSLAIKAARAAEAGAVADQGAAQVVNIGASATIQDIIDAAYDAAAAMDDLYLPANDRFVIVSPSTFWGMTQNTKLLDKDTSDRNGSYADGSVMKVAGMSIVKSANLAVDHTSATRYPDSTDSKYAVDATDTGALVYQKGALATVKLMDVASEGEYDIRRQGTLMVSKMAVGHGAVAPQGIIELRKV